jgi:hypothetical protein
MIVTILIIVALLFVVGLASGIRFVYLLAAPHSNIQLNMKSKALDLFLYLGIAISLIMSVSNLLQIIFAAITLKFPDVLAYPGYVDGTQSDVRLAIASLVVMFPIYIGLSWYVANNIKKYLFKQDISVRKIMIYCTLFASLLTLAGTLVYAIYTYLGGEISTVFELKALAVLVVALALFGYYYYALKRDYSKPTVIPALITVLVAVVVGASVVWSVSIIGTPKEMRAKKIDSTRLSDISRIQQEVFNRVQSADKLPLTLTELDNAFQGYQVPVDPMTKESYTYKVIQQPIIKMNYATTRKEMATQAVFQLCATFDTVRKVDSRGQAIVGSPIKGDISATDAIYSASNYYYEGDQSPFWNHDKGETCFKRIISPDMYYGR